MLIQEVKRKKMYLKDKGKMAFYGEPTTKIN